MAFRPVEKRRVAEQIADSVRDSIVSGDLEAGDTLPSERDLAEQFQVNRSSVREALHRLEAWGLVEIRQGGATRVRNLLTSVGLHLLPHMLAPGGRLDPDLLRDLFEVRVALLGWAAQWATRRAEPEGVARLDAILTELDAATTDAARQAADFEFFTQLVAMADNRILSLIINAVAEVYARNKAMFVALYRDGAYSTENHHRALTAIREGDAVAARDAMESYGQSAFAGGTLR